MILDDGRDVGVKRHRWGTALLASSEGLRRSVAASSAPLRTAHLPATRRLVALIRHSFVGERPDGHLDLARLPDEPTPAILFQD